MAISPPKLANATETTHLSTVGWPQGRAERLKAAASCDTVSSADDVRAGERWLAARSPAVTARFRAPPVSSVQCAQRPVVAVI